MLGGRPNDLAMAAPNPQLQLDVPLDVAVGLAKGVFTQSGSVVRWALGPLKVVADRSTSTSLKFAMTSPWRRWRTAQRG